MSAVPVNKITPAYLQQPAKYREWTTITEPFRFGETVASLILWALGDKYHPTSAFPDASKILFSPLDRPSTPTRFGLSCWPPVVPGWQLIDGSGKSIPQDTLVLSLYTHGATSGKLAASGALSICSIDAENHVIHVNAIAHSAYPRELTAAYIKDWRNTDAGRIGAFVALGVHPRGLWYHMCATHVVVDRIVSGSPVKCPANMTIFTAWQLILTLGRESPYVNLEVGGRPFPAYLSRLVMAEIGVGKAGVEVIACLGWLAGLNILYKSVKIPGPAPLIFTPAFANRLQGKIRKDFGIGFDLVLNMAEAPRLFTTLELVEMMNPLAEDAEGTQGTED